MRTLANAVLAINVLGYLWIGLYALVAPGLLLEPVGLVLAGTGTVEARATYGGMMLAIACGYGLGLMRAEWRRPALALLLLLSAGLAAGRAIGLALVGPVGWLLWAFLAFEAISAAVAAAALSRPDQ